MFARKALVNETRELCGSRVWTSELKDQVSVVLAAAGAAASRSRHKAAMRRMMDLRCNTVRHNGVILEPLTVPSRSRREKERSMRFLVLVALLLTATAASAQKQWAPAPVPNVRPSENVAPIER